MKPALAWALFLVVLVSHYVECYGVLHKILKINENASIDELKIAYEKLIKQWYKANKMLAAEAEILHLKLVQAYRELKNQMDINFHDKHVLPSDYKSAVQSLNVDILHRISIPFRSYNSDLLKNSFKRIHLVLFYTVNSSDAYVIQNWFNLLEILTPFGVVMVTINMDHGSVENASGILSDYSSSFPRLVLLIDGIEIPYKNEKFVDFMIMDFIRRNLPDNLIQVKVDGFLTKYLSSWHQDNKVRTLFFQPSLPIRFHYLLIAFLHRQNVLFGFINLADENSGEIQLKMNISNKMDTFVLFKENTEVPSVKICMPSVPAKLLNDTISKNNHLVLPRIISQELFDELCPAPSEQYSLCVILVIKNSLQLREFDPKISFRRFIEEYSDHFPTVSFMYIYNDYQPKFTLPIEEMNSLTNEHAPYIVALERIDQSHVKYALLMHQHESWDDYEKVEEQLKLSIENILARKQLLFTNSLKMNQFVEEKPPSLIYRIYYRLRTYISKITLSNIFPYLIPLGTVFYFLSVLSGRWRKLQCLWNEIVLADDVKGSKSEELQAPLQPCKKKQPSSPLIYLENGKCISTSRELRLHELKAETYNGMVRLLKPGCRTIILMFDRVRADLLVSQFYKAVWPYRKNKNLLFGYVNMEKKATLDWYSELVKACLPEQQEIEINPYFCAGTVLALSGMRKYFCLYHLKHPGILPNKEKGEPSFCVLKSTYTDEELLIGLREWLDKLFDGSGSVIRYRVNHWPDFKIL